jgi:hypothetical protein
MRVVAVVLLGSLRVQTTLLVLAGMVLLLRHHHRELFLQLLPLLLARLLLGNGFTQVKLLPLFKFHLLAQAQAALAHTT